MTTSMKRFLNLVFIPPVVTVAIKTSLVVGLLLNLINNGTSLWNHEPINWLNAGLNFLVPFCVSAYSGARSAMLSGNPSREPE